MVEFTKRELNLICNYAMDAARKAYPKISYFPLPYEEAQAIFEKAHKGYMEMEKKEGR